MQDSSENKRRLKWKCRRGMLELDELFEGFLEKKYDTLSADDKNIFEEILEESDQDLYEYFMKHKQPTDGRYQHVIEAIRTTVAD